MRVTVRSCQVNIIRIFLRLSFSQQRLIPAGDLPIIDSRDFYTLIYIYIYCIHIIYVPLTGEGNSRNYTEQKGSYVRWSWNLRMLPGTCKSAAYSDIRHATHYNDVIMGAMASQITSLTVLYSTIYSGTDQRKHLSSASLAFVWGIPRTKGQ